jgi:DNA invertase Pin-like site-specific DNA recombinase
VPHAERGNGSPKFHASHPQLCEATDDFLSALQCNLDQQNIDTTTPTGRLLFQITGAFGEFERSMIRQRVRAGLNVIKDKLARDGKFVSKAGKVRRGLGRPGAEPDKIQRARRELAKGIGIGKVAREVGLGVGTVHRLKREVGAHEA